MKLKHLPFLLVLSIVGLMPIVASADVVISVGSDGATHVDTGAARSGVLIDFFLGQETNANDSLLAIVADYDFAAGVLTGGAAGEIGSSAAPGFYGAGNLLTSIFTIVPPASVNVNQELDDSQSLLQGGLERWFQVELDTTGVAAGTYAINLQQPGGSFLNSSFNFVASNNNLTFSVSAVPEPGSAIFMGAGLLMAAALRRRSR